ncbi:ATP synthase-coupling factor 6, mitochondrial [Spea bombifrons]|uniref:ATP synthase-coupling factor 6, mitochondrial n=1 Tax=Spea bombifrons TaxID=233779 RepID=UPI00234AE516|nr:ATP synthase-coupling factor 6, mitochondrial [Spea bombifrons]
MVVQRLFRLSSVLRSAVSVHLRRNIGLTAIAFNKTKELDPVQKIFVEKIREYNTKSQKAGGPVDAGTEYQKDLNEDISKLQRLYGGGDLTQFPKFKFEEPKFEDAQK